jgi:short-subunit dehydrogenase
MSVHVPGTIVLTGAGGQVGSALARRLAGVAPLALIGADAAPPGAGAQAPVRAFGRVDLCDQAAVEQVIGELRASLGPIRALVHTVGAYADGRSVEQQSLEQVRRMLELNFLAALGITRAVLPDLLASAGARIVLFASGDALRARAGASAYAASKAALLRFAEALAEEVTARGVGVCVLLPTTIDTPTARAAASGADVSGWVTLDQVAATVTFLLDPASGGIRFAAIPLGR